MTRNTGNNCFTSAQDKLIELFTGVDEAVGYFASPLRPLVVLPRDPNELAKYIFVNAYRRPADYKVYTQEELAALFPLILIATDPEEQTLYHKDSESSFGEKAGTLTAIFIRLWESNFLDPEFVLREMENMVGSLVEAVAALSCLPGHLGLLDISLGPAEIGKWDEKIVVSDLGGEEVMQQATFRWGVEFGG